MTNEEKATCIANANQCIDRNGYSSFKECENSALEMAAWKDRQLKEYLEKKREKFKGEINKCSFNSFTEYSIAKKMELLYEIINELFKE